MSKILKVKTTIINQPLTDKVNEFAFEISNALIGQTFEIEYVLASQGGPLMIPKNPPA